MNYINLQDSTAKYLILAPRGLDPAIWVNNPHPTPLKICLAY
jgi:hypothetical protein